MKKINFRVKMIGVMVVILAVFLSFGFLMKNTINKAEKTESNLYNGSIVLSHQMSQLNSSLLLKVQIPLQQFRTQEKITASSGYQLRTAMKDIRNQLLKIRNERNHTPQEQALLSNMAANLDDMFGKVENIINFRGDITKKQDHLQWQKLYDIFDKTVQKFQENASAFTLLKVNNDKQLITNIKTYYSRIHRINNTVLIIGFLLILFLSLTFIIDITRKYKIVVKYLVHLSKGDLTEDIPEITHDEMGWILRHVRLLQDSLRKITIEVNTAVNNMSIASHDLSASSQNIAQGSSQQASSVEEISSSVEQLASNIHQVADNAKATEKVVVQLSKTTSLMVEAARKSQEKMDAIAEKIGIISEIAFQTNILALNAAVEAARAGEHGRGFGVVAVEVGKLAERSKKASSEIEGLIHESVSVIEDAGKIMLEVAPEVDKTSDMVKSISAASIEQKLGADQINDAVQQFNEVAQQNAAASEEIATSAEELSAQADRLMDSQSFFKLKEEDMVNNIPGNTAPIVKKKIPQSVSTGNKSNPRKGVDIDLEKPDDLDEGYERF